MSDTNAEPLAPADFSKGLQIRTYIGGGILLVAVLLGVVLADPDGAPGSVAGWLGADAFAGITRGVLLLIIAVVVDAVLLSQWMITGSKRVAAWRRAD